MTIRVLLFGLGLILSIQSCSESAPVPRPPAILRLEIPKSEYTISNNVDSYSFENNVLYKTKNSIDTLNPKFKSSQQFELEPFNSTMQLWHYELSDTNALEFYINTTIDMMEERHLVLATGVEDEQTIRLDDRVFGTLFEIKGNVATPFQFYLTDSTSNFVRGEILVNFKPNYDSLIPSLNYIKQDLDHLMKTFKWTDK